MRIGHSKNGTIFSAMLSLFLLIGIIGASPAAAQADETESTVVAVVRALQEEVRARLDKAAVALRDVNKEVEQAARADNQLAELKVQADAVTQAIVTSIASLQTRYDLVAKRIEELGAAPAEGATEDPSVAADRKRLFGEKAQMNTILSDADALRSEATRISNHITDLRRELFAATLFLHTEFSGEMFDEFLTAARQETGDLSGRSTSAFEFMWRFKANSLFLVLGLSLLAALIFIGVVQKMFAPLLRRDKAEQNPGYIHRLTLAFWSALIPSVAVAAFVLISLMLLLGFRVLREDMVQIYGSIMWSLAGIYFVLKLSRSIVAPGKPQWRLVDVSDRGANTLVWYALLIAIINGFSYVAGQTNIALDSPVVLTVAKSFVCAVLLGIVLLALSFVKPMRRDAETNPDGSWPKFIRFVLVAAGIGLILTALMGYVGLAQFAATQIVVTGAILVTVYLGFMGGHAVSRHEAFAKTAAGRALAKRYGLSDIRLDQIGLLVGLGIYLLVAMIGLPLIMLKWGFAGTDIWVLAVQSFTEIQIGNITISLFGVLAGILLFIAGLFGTRWFQRWLDGNVLSRTQWDPGVRNSVNTTLGYAGVALAGIIGVSAAGINLSSIAVVAGALSLGIGFGLQTIVSNFVSGLILLAERPFKVGDWIVAGPVEGFVRHIAVRATEIETFQNQSILIPNSQLINASVGNWTLRNTLARSEVPVSVSYSSDPRKVMDILLEIAVNHPLVLTMPEPNVGFVRFGEFTLDFELRFYLADLFTAGAVRNDLRLEIFERFHKEGIEISPPRQNININMPGTAPADESQAPGAKSGADKVKDAAAERRRRNMQDNARDIDAVDDGAHHQGHDPGEREQDHDDEK